MKTSPHDPFEARLRRDALAFQRPEPDLVERVSAQLGEPLPRTRARALAAAAAIVLAVSALAFGIRSRGGYDDVARSPGEAPSAQSASSSSRLVKSVLPGALLGNLLTTAFGQDGEDPLGRELAAVVDDVELVASALAIRIQRPFGAWTHRN